MRPGNGISGTCRQVLLLLLLGMLILGSCVYASDGEEVPGAGNVTVEVSPTVTVTPEVTETPTAEVTESPETTPTETLAPEPTTTPEVTQTTEPEPTDTVVPEITVTSESTPNPEPEPTETPVPALTPASVVKMEANIQNDPHLAPINPEFLEYQNSKLSYGIQKAASRDALMIVNNDGSISHVFLEGEIPSPIDRSAATGQTIVPLSAHQRSIDLYDPTYDLRTFGKVSSVKNQGNAGSCWAFATYGSLESTLLTGESWDFSENNMKNLLAETFPNSTPNPNGFDRAWDEGGNEYMSSAYLARWSGAISEADDPYSDSSGVSPEGLTPVKHVQNVYFLPARASSTDNDNIKYALTTWGAVKASIYYDNSYYNAGTYAFYNGVTTSTNHAITIVGWDDSYSRFNFASTPAGDGAFIVKNSWGTGWGNAGYFYVSYYDLTIGDKCAVFTGEPVTNYDRVYSYDPLGWVLDYGYGTTSARYANVFTAESPETLKAVGFYTPVSNTVYTVNVYRSPSSGPIGTLAATTSGTLTSPGYHTVTVPDVMLAEGEHFSIVVSATTPGYNYPIPIEYPYSGYSSHATAHAGESYISSNGVTWTDMTAAEANTNVCLKGYSALRSAVNFTANQTEGQTPFAVKFTDTSYVLTPTQWAWTFGDGETFTTTSSSQKSPTHTYFRPGNYTVNLTVTHAGGTTTESKPLYINVSRSTSPTRPPENATKLIFIHHSCGQNWLMDDNGGLGTALENNNYFVSDTNYEWGPDQIGDHTDIGDWWSWFRGPSSSEYLGDLYNESGQHSTYTRLATDPGGPNEIVMFKSCFPNSALHGSPSDPVPSIGDNPLKGQSCGSEDHSVANAKGIYIDLLEYFGEKPDTLFVVITAPPLTTYETAGDPATRANARALNQWLVNDWLDDYNVGNVFVFDLYNVLTTNNGNINTNDLGLAGGNHHRWWNDAVQHQVANFASNTSAYATGSDSHPTEAGNRKATGEYVPLLNYAYNWWTDNRTPYEVDFTANVTTGYLPLAVQFTDSSTVVSPTYWNWSFGDGQVFGTAIAGQKNPVYLYTTAGTYAVRLDVTNATGTYNRTKNAYITASPITANFTANATFGTVRMPVLFTDSSTGTPTAWNWSFGDGRYSSQQNPLHFYNASGNFSVTLNATNTYSTDTFTRTNYINVNPAPRPQITAVSPTTATLNTTINVTITGKYFQTGAFETWANFTYISGGQTFDNRNLTITEVTATKINATMIIGPGMPTGKWNLTVTTVDGGASVKKLSAITVSRFPVPVVTSISPVSGYRNSTVTYAIIGSNFKPGQTTVYFTNKTGGILNVTEQTTVSTTRINGTIVVPHNAPLGAWNLNVGTVDSGGNGTKLSAFTVNRVLAPTMGALTPATGSRNVTTAFTLAGTNFQTEAGKTSVRVYEDVMDTDLPVTITGITATKITGTITAAAGASPGSYIVDVTTVDGGTVTRAGGFKVIQAAIPTLSSMTPSSGYRNGTVAYTVKGTGFQPGKTTVVLKNQTTGAVLGTMTADSVTATTIQGNLTIPVAAPPGYYRLDVTTVDGGVVNRINAFRVDAVKAPVMGAITPTTGSKNTTVAFTLTGMNFQTDPGQTSVAIVDDTSGTNLAATIYSVTSTKIIGSFTIPAATPPGKYRLELTTTDGGTVTKADAFTVNYLPLPTISSLTPASGNRGSTVKFTLKGKDFLDGGTVVKIRATGNTINGVLSSVNSTTVIGNFTIPAGAATGPYRLDVYTVGGGINSRTNAFTVK